MLPHIITTGIPYAQLLDDLRAIIQQEVARGVVPSQPSYPDVGGIELAQQITRLSKARVYALVSERQLPHTKRGNKLYFTRVELLAWMEKGRRDTK